MTKGPSMPATKRYGLLAIIGLSTPFALVVETGVRKVIMPPDFDEVRAWLSPEVTPYAWAMAPLAVVATAIGFFLQRWLVRRALRRPLRAGMTRQRAQQRAEFDALMLSTSAPQVPALLGTVLFMLGSKLDPVLVTMAVATVGVLSLGLTMGHSAAEPDDVESPPTTVAKSTSATRARASEAARCARTATSSAPIRRDDATHSSAGGTGR